MLFEDLRVAPAAGPIELGDDHPAAFKEDLEDAVLVRVELDQATVALQADGIERIEHIARRQVGVGGGPARSFRRISAHRQPPARAGVRG